MSERYINTLNVNPFLCSLIFQAFYNGYEEKQCPLVLHYLVLPIILCGESRKTLNSINKTNNLRNLISQNKLDFIDLQSHIWFLRKLTHLSLISLHNKCKIELGSKIVVLEEIDYNNYNEDLKEYLRSATYLGTLFHKESVENVFFILNVIP